MPGGHEKCTGTERPEATVSIAHKYRTIFLPLSLPRNDNATITPYFMGNGGARRRRRARVERASE